MGPHKLDEGLPALCPSLGRNPPHKQNLKIRHREAACVATEARGRGSPGPCTRCDLGRVTSSGSEK